MKKMIVQCAELALLLTAFACLGVYAVAQAQTARTQAEAIKRIEVYEQHNPLAKPDTKLWSENRVAKFDSSEAGELVPLGVLSIPDVEIRVAVFDGTSDKTLDVGAGRVPGSARAAGDGNLAIAAHRDGFFRGLKNIAVGDEVLFANQDGTHRYTVTKFFVVEPTDVSVLDKTELPTITLITCYPFYFVGNAPQRFIVRAELSTTKSESFHLEN